MRFLLLFFIFVGSSSACAEVFSQDPRRFDLRSIYSEYSRSDLVDVRAPDEAKKLFMVGLLYLRGEEGFDIKKDCHKAFSSLKKSWDMGGVDPGYTLSMMYYGGYCVEKDWEKSKYFIERSAEKGYLLSQRKIGRAYWGCPRCGLKGLYPRDMEKAIYWLSKAGEAGDKQSSGNLSYIFLEGLGVEKDEKKAFKWKLRAVNSDKYFYGEIAGFNSLAEFYENGVGTKRDLVQAYKYYDLSMPAGAKGKKRIRSEMTQEQIEEALRQSREWQREHNVEVGSGFIRRVD